MNSEQRDAAIRTGAKALAYARVKDWSRAGEAVQELHDNYEGGEGIQLFLLGLADTLLIHQGAKPQQDAMVLPMWVDPSGDTTLFADDVPPPLRWAGRFIAARAALDEPACAALYESIANDEEFTDNVCALLDIVATSLNMIVGAPQ